MIKNNAQFEIDFALNIPSAEIKTRISNKQILLDGELITSLQEYRELWDIYDFEKTLSLGEFLCGNNINDDAKIFILKSYDIGVWADNNSFFCKRIFRNKSILRIGKNNYKHVFVLSYKDGQKTKYFLKKKEKIVKIVEDSIKNFLLNRKNYVKQKYVEFNLIGNKLWDLIRELENDLRMELYLCGDKDESDIRIIENFRYINKELDELCVKVKKIRTIDYLLSQVEKYHEENNEIIESKHLQSNIIEQINRVNYLLKK